VFQVALFSSGRGARRGGPGPPGRCPAAEQSGGRPRWGGPNTDSRRLLLERTAPPGKDKQEKVQYSSLRKINTKSVQFSFHGKEMRKTGKALSSFPLDSENQENCSHIVFDKLAQSFELFIGKAGW
jgi:hypothetical protein